MDSRPVPPVILPTPTGAVRRHGVWSADEHDRFLQALKRFPDGPWQQLALCVGTRSTRQVQTHAQKYFDKIRRRQRGLRRAYVHTGMVREHRVDDDVVAILSAMSTSGQGNGDRSENDDHEDGKGEGDGNDTEESKVEGSGEDREEREGEYQIDEKDSSFSTSKSPRSTRSAGKRKRSNCTQDSNAAEELLPTLPRRVRIRRSPRNALQLAANRDQFYAQAMGLATADDDTMATTPLESLVSIDPVEPARTILPSIEEALDFFLHTIDSESITTMHQQSTPL